MLTDEQRMFAIEDARTHLAAQFDLIKVHDQKAMTFLGLYITVGIAAVGLALTIFGKEPLIGVSTAWGLGAASVALTIGAFYCFKTIERSKVSLPGRDFDFWRVANNHPDGDFKGAVSTYLVDGQTLVNEMRVLNVRLANHLRIVKGAAIAAPISAAIVGLGVEAYPFVIASLKGWFLP